jgi:SAM-dependent methyltransferase
MRNSEPNRRYWDQVFQDKKASFRLNAWRKYMKFVYCALMVKWFDERDEAGPGVKTDLFEEASSEHPLLPELAAVGIGVDHSLQIALSAKQRLPPGNAARILVCDLRKLSLRSNSVKRILSPSSLDHFPQPSDIDQALQELHRILTPGGILILTLDNPHNPAVWIRNHLPISLLNRLGLVPYYVGCTCTRDEAFSRLKAAGFEVTDCTAISHVPRAPTIWMVRLAEILRAEGFAEWLSCIFQKWEKLQGTRLRYRTGYFLAIRALKMDSS